MRDGVRLFDKGRPTCLSTDWSNQGVGFILRQKYCNCSPTHPACCPQGWKLCLVGSRFNSPAESRYSPIEGEALAVAYALHQTRYYVLGCTDLTVATDHKPLLRILDDRPLTEITNRRLLNLKEKTTPFTFKIIHVPGRRNQGPDATSRYPSLPPEHFALPCDPPALTEDLAGDSHISAAACATLCSVSDVVTWDMVQEATVSDVLLTRLTRLIHEGFPEDCRSLSPDLRPYHRYRDSLSCVDGVVLLGDRIVIPADLRPHILQALHAAHQGVNVMCARAAESVFWPNMTADITMTRDRCSDCHRIAPSNPMLPPAELPDPDYPFQQVCCDYFHYHGHDYLVIVDRYSNWPMVFRSESGAQGLIKRLREFFVTFGIAENLTSDGGPQFRAGDLKAFLKSWGVHHRITSVANPHGNCRAEIGVKTVKRMLMDNIGPSGSLDTDKFQRAMLTYRNSIDPETKTSPAMVIFGRPIRDAIPIPLGKYCPHPTWRELMSHREKALAKRHTRGHEKWDEHTRALPPLKVGDKVFLQNLTGNYPKRWEHTGVVVEVRQFHQYAVRVDGSGRVTLRNRQHLRRYVPFKTSSPPTPVVTPVAPAHVPSLPLPTPSVTPVSPIPVTPACPVPMELPPEVPPDRDPSQPSVFSEAPSTLADGNDSTTEMSPELPVAVTSAPGSARNNTPPSLPSKPKIARALSRLLPHNSAGTRECEPMQRHSRTRYTKYPP